MKKERVYFTPEAKEIIRKYYENTHAHDLIKMLPGYRLNSIQAAAHRMGLVKQKHLLGGEPRMFSPDMEAKLKELYPKSSWSELSKEFPGYTRLQITGLASRLGVKKEKSVVDKIERVKHIQMCNFTPEENAILIAKYPLVENHILVQEFPGRTIRQLTNRAHHLGIKKHAERVTKKVSKKPVRTPKPKPIKISKPVLIKHTKTKEQKPSFKTRFVDLNSLVPVRIDHRTTLYIRPGKDPEKKKAEFMRSVNKRFADLTK